MVLVFDSWCVLGHFNCSMTLKKGIEAATRRSVCVSLCWFLINIIWQSFDYLHNKILIRSYYQIARGKVINRRYKIFFLAFLAKIYVALVLKNIQ
jgi:hypothetical protein